LRKNIETQPSLCKKERSCRVQPTGKKRKMKEKGREGLAGPAHTKQGKRRVKEK